MHPAKLTVRSGSAASVAPDVDCISLRMKGDCHEGVEGHGPVAGPWSQGR